MSLNLYSFLAQTNSQKIAIFLAQNQERQLTEKEIQKMTLISKTGVHLGLRELSKMGLVEKVKRGKISFYQIKNTPFIKQWKIAVNISFLTPLIKQMRTCANQMILFGSWARGENNSQSDIDLVIITNASEEQVRKIIDKSKLSKKIQAIVKNAVAFAKMAQSDPVFYHEVESGIVLFAEK